MAKVSFEYLDHAYRIVLNAPPLNILDIEMLGELRDALATVRHDKPLLIIDGAGSKAFSAGASVQDHVGDRVITMLELFHDCFRILNRLESVTVATVRGVALGGGCELALACDFVLASSSSRFGLPEIQLGVFPPVAAWQMSRQLPRRKGLELLLTGDPISAEEAQSLGLVNAVLSDGDFAESAAQWMRRIMRQSTSSLRLAKRAFRIAAAEDFDARLREVEQLYLGELMKTKDASEGLAAFLEKRPPSWRGE